MAGPLEGVCVIEITGVAAAPFGVMMLADMGADVIRVDRIPGGAAPVRDPRSDVLNRGRKSIAVDMKSPRGLEIVRRLASDADVIVEAFRPGVMERLGLGPDRLLQDNRRLVYARMTGWGQDGDLAKRAGHDINFIGVTGALHALGSADAPPTPPLNLVGDFGGGGMYLAFGIVCALMEARSTGKGQVVDAAMIDGAASLMSIFYPLTQAGHWRDARGSNRLDGAAPHYATYETADGKYMAVGALETHFYTELLKGLELENEALPPPHDKANWPRLKERFTAAFKTRDRAEWVRRFDALDACVTPVLGIAEAASFGQIAQRKTLVEHQGFTQPAPAPRLSRTPAALGLPPSLPGEHSEEILRSLGIGDVERAQLLESGSVLQARAPTA